MFTLLADGREEVVPGLTVPAGEKVLGWERKPHGWCQGDACIPAFRAAAAETAVGTDLVAWPGCMRASPPGCSAAAARTPPAGTPAGRPSWRRTTSPSAAG